MQNMNYDEADLHSIQVSAAANGIHLDEGTSIFLARELDYVKAKVYEKEHPALTATTLFPVSNEVPDYAKTFTYGVFDAVGMAKIIADYSDDLPNVGVNFREETGKVWSLGNFYEYSLQEIRESQATGKNLQTRLPNAARRAHDIAVNDLVFKGNANYGIVSIFDHPNIPVTVSAGWSDGQTAISEVEDAFTAVETLTNSLHSPNVIALPPSKFKILSKPLTGTGISFREYFDKQYPGITWMRVNELENIDGNGTKGALIFERDIDNASIEIPQPFEQLPPQANNLAFKVPCHSRATGVIVYLPLTLHLIKGI